MARFARGQFLGEGELQYLDSGLRLEVGPRTQKRTLQRLCEWLEKERLLADVSPVRQLIHSLMGSSGTLVKRWSNEALALISHPNDFHRLVARLRVEEDGEAQTWAVAGEAEELARADAQLGRRESSACGRARTLEILGH